MWLFWSTSYCCVYIYTNIAKQGGNRTRICSKRTKHLGCKKTSITSALFSTPVYKLPKLNFKRKENFYIYMPHLNIGCTFTCCKYKNASECHAIYVAFTILLVFPEWVNKWRVPRLGDAHRKMHCCTAGMDFRAQWIRHTMHKENLKIKFPLECVIR